MTIPFPRGGIHSTDKNKSPWHYEVLPNGNPIDRVNQQNYDTLIDIINRQKFQPKERGMTEIRLELDHETTISDIIDFAELAQKYGEDGAKTVLAWRDKKPVLSFTPSSKRLHGKHITYCGDSGTPHTDEAIRNASERLKGMRRPRI